MKCVSFELIELFSAIDNIRFIVLILTMRYTQKDVNKRILCVQRTFDDVSVVFFFYKGKEEMT